MDDRGGGVFTPMIVQLVPWRGTLLGLDNRGRIYEIRGEDEYGRSPVLINEICDTAALLRRDFSE
jgi:hypothetical protein